MIDRVSATIGLKGSRCCRFTMGEIFQPHGIVVEGCRKHVGHVEGKSFRESLLSGKPHPVVIRIRKRFPRVDTGERGNGPHGANAVVIVAVEVEVPPLTTDVGELHGFEDFPLDIRESLALKGVELRLC